MKKTLAALILFFAVQAFGQFQPVKRNGTNVLVPDYPIDNLRIVGGNTTLCPVFDSNGAIIAGTCTSGSTGAAIDLSNVNPTVGRLNLGAAAGAQIPKTNLMSYYNFSQGSGTVLTDIAGMNNGTLCPNSGGITTPAWISTICLNFGGSPASKWTDCVSLPAALNTAQSVVFAGNINSLSNSSGYFAINGQLVLSNSTLPFYSSNSFVLADIPANSANAFSPAVFNQSTAPDFYTSGYHVYGIDFGNWNGTSCSSYDTFYIDGQPVTGTYPLQGCSGNRYTTGQFYIGANLGTTGTGPSWVGAQYGLNANAYTMLFYSANLGAAGQLAAASAIRTENAARGVTITPPVVPQSVGTLHCVGDSITFGYPSLSPFCSNLSLTNPPTTGVVNWGISGINLDAVTGAEDNRVALQCSAGAGQSVANVMLGTNNFLAIPQDTPLSVFNKLVTEGGKLKYPSIGGRGCRIFADTMISRNNATPPGATACSGSYDTCKKAYNALILGGAKSAGYDATVDFASFPGLGADGAYANPGSTCANAANAIWGTSACFQADGIHPTQAGHYTMGAIYSAVYNYLFGYNESNPNNVAATTYQMLTSDGSITATGSAAQAFTTPDCTGLSGYKFVINNPTAYTDTIITGRAAQTLNGYTTAQNIAAHTSFTMTAKPYSEVTSGCYWAY